VIVGRCDESVGLCEAQRHRPNVSAVVLEMTTSGTRRPGRVGGMDAASRIW
jgi:hypothetical protein